MNQKFHLSVWEIRCKYGGCEVEKSLGHELTEKALSNSIGK
jgi:hypothetical protein